MLQILFRLDTPTLYIAASIVFSVMAGILHLVGKRYNAGYRGIDFWAGGTMACALSFLLFALRPVIGVPLSSIFGMTALAGTLSLLSIGLEKFFTIKNSTKLQIALLGLYALWQLFFNFYIDNVYHRIFGFGLVAGFISFHAAYELLVGLRGVERAMARFTAFIFCFYGSMALVRSAIVGVKIFRGVVPVYNDPTGGVLLLVTLATTMLLVFSLITLLYQSQTRALQERADELGKSREALEEHCRMLKKNVEEKTFQLYEAEKLAIMGTLAAGVAHEISNPNQIIATNLSLAGRFIERVDEYLVPDARTRESFGALSLGEFIDRLKVGIGQAQTASERISAIARDLREEAIPKSDNVPQVLNIAEVIRSSVRSCGVQFDTADIDLQFDFPDKSKLCRGYRHQLEQVFINIIQNAVLAAGSKKGTVSVRLYEEGEYAVSTIEDNGCGIEKRLIPLVTNPFYTTRRTAGGTGLGLFVVSRILHRHGGDMLIESEPGKGTTVTILLPRCSDV